MFLTSNNNFIYIYKSVGVQKSLKKYHVKPRGFLHAFQNTLFLKNFLAVKSLKNVVYLIPTQPLQGRGTRLCKRVDQILTWAII